MRNPHRTQSSRWAARCRHRHLRCSRTHRLAGAHRRKENRRGRGGADADRPCNAGREVAVTRLTGHALPLREGRGVEGCVHAMPAMTPPPLPPPLPAHRPQPCVHVGALTATSLPLLLRRHASSNAFRVLSRVARAPPASRMHSGVSARPVSSVHPRERSVLAGERTSHSHCAHCTLCVHCGVRVGWVPGVLRVSRRGGREPRTRDFMFMRTASASWTGEVQGHYLIVVQGSYLRHGMSHDHEKLYSICMRGEQDVLACIVRDLQL